MPLPLYVWASGVELVAAGETIQGLAGGLFLPGADSTPDQWVPGQQTCPGLAPLDPAGVF